MDILHTPCVPIIIVHSLFSCTHLHVEYRREFEHSHALHTYRHYYLLSILHMQESMF